MSIYDIESGVTTSENVRGSVRSFDGDRALCIDGAGGSIFDLATKQITPLKLGEGVTEARMHGDKIVYRIDATLPEKKPYQTAEAKRKQNRIHNLRLIENKRDRTPHDVAIRLPDVVHQLKERKIVANQPNQVR